jgi:hypothetical protein
LSNSRLTLEEVEPFAVASNFGSFDINTLKRLPQALREQLALRIGRDFAGRRIIRSFGAGLPHDADPGSAVAVTPGR